MKSFVIYDSSGFILRAGKSENNISQINNSDEYELIVDWPEDIKTYTVQSNKLVKKSDQIVNADETKQAWLFIRSHREILLSSSDYTQLPDSPLTDAKKQEWATYRQALRDLPTTADSSNITWPTEPD